MYGTFIDEVTYVSKTYSLQFYKCNIFNERFFFCVNSHAPICIHFVVKSKYNIKDKSSFIDKNYGLLLLI